MKKLGRPLKYTVEELEKKINDYFEYCDKTGKPYTVTGLAVFLGTSRETLLDYEGRPAFTDAIQKAKEKCKAYAEEYLFSGKNPTGAIFSLTNNYGWVNKQHQQVDADIKGGVQVLFNIPRPTDPASGEK